MSDCTTTRLTIGGLLGLSRSQFGDIFQSSLCFTLFHPATYKRVEQHKLTDADHSDTCVPGKE